MRKQLPVFLGFFVMGFVDVVGIATNYAKKDLHLHDSVANLLPLMVFLWFALFSVPTGLLMNRIGRRKTVLWAMVITLLALLVPFLAYNFVVLLAAFALIGIGNTILQVSLNPLLTNVVQPQRLTSALTGGQLIKAIASFLGPVIAGAASFWLGDWRLIFPLFAFVTLLNTLWLWSTPIAEQGHSGRTTSFLDCLRLLSDPLIVQLLIGVIAIVGLDVGFNTTLPKFIMAHSGLPLEKAGLGTSLYFIARTTGSLAGVIILAKARARRVFLATTIIGIFALTGLLLASPLWLILVFIFLLGFSVANVFPILFATALRRAPQRENEVSGLLIMGVSGGAILLPIMGIIGDAKGPAWALGFLLVAWGYLAWVGRRL
ncbi:MFS transporter [Puia dinghuensis]|uniref:MFS transporter n=1 Tax=Puia dinghuensis TaxID=1792502 RepID=A0A8J2UHP6_9BACT|nr:MFS transporter [Puia dinghuensis]GGB19707.1 MFS transporter [Puia dinghuensis]